MSNPTPPGFAAALDAVAGVAGWMTDAQARCLWDRAALVRPDGRIVEIGSYQGRSLIVLARAATRGVDIVAIDPHAGNDRGPQEIHGTADEGDRDHEAFLNNLDRAGIRDLVRHVRLASHEACSEVEGQIDLLYIDGAHRYTPARADIREWGDRVASGGTMLIHDSFCAIGVTAAIADQLVAGRRFRFVGRTGSLAEYRCDPMRAADRWRNAARQLAQLPWFARNVLVKVLFVLRLRPLARILGHTTDEWPY